MLFLAAFLSVAMTPASAQLADDLFDQYELVTGSAKRQTALSGFLLGGPVAELAVVHVDDRGSRRLEIYTFIDDAWMPALDALLRPGVLFVDMAHIGGNDRLITYERGRLSWFDPESATERLLVKVTTDYNATQDGLHYAGAELLGPSHKADIPQIDITRDVNRDGLDDLVLPDVDGFWISTQSGDGSFADAVKLGPPEPFLDQIALGETRSYRDVGITALTIPWYLSRLHEVDYNGDGRSDLVFWNDDHFEVHLQDMEGRFNPAAKTFSMDLPLDADGVYSHLFGFSDVGTFRLLMGFRKKTKRTVVYSMRDMNDDGIADLVTQSLKGRSLLRQRGRYEVRLGKRALDGTVFERDVDSVIEPQGRAGGMQSSGYSSQLLQDFDGDGHIDVMFRDVRVGIGGMMRALVGNSVPIDLELYSSEGGIYPDEPSATRKIRRFVPFGGMGNVFFPAVLMGDVNGDSRADLLVGWSPEELHIFPGVPGPDLLARLPEKVAVSLPHDERGIQLVDLNRDGKKDLLVHHAPTTEPHRVVTLIAR